jgi:hypothetical protein
MKGLYGMDRTAGPQRLQSSMRVVKWANVRPHDEYGKRTRHLPNFARIGAQLHFVELTERLLCKLRRLEFSHSATVGDFYDCRALLGK